MKPLSRRSVVAGGTLAAAAWALRAAAQAGGGTRTIEMVARRFAFEPTRVDLRAGERVQVVVRALDFVHGMNIPDLGKRYDLVPGQPTRFELQLAAPGAIEFLCDNFCGEGHENMHGRFVVS